MSRMTASETCACGASVKLDGWPPHVSAALGGWREDHKHAEAVGICGDLAKPFGDRPPESCDLKAGHAGMHGNNSGMSWRHLDMDADSEPSGADLRDFQASGVVRGANEGDERG